MHWMLGVRLCHILLLYGFNASTDAVVTCKTKILHECFILRAITTLLLIVNLVGSR